MSVATLSGWGQAHDALADIAPGALHLDYARHSSAQAALLDIAAQAKDCDTLIGWSLGGQLAVRAVASGMLKPRRLVLVAAPFQFVATPENPLGMKRFTYDKFRDNYERNPERTLHKAWELVASGDRHAERIRVHLAGKDKAAVLQKDWLRWLTLLDGFTCDGLDFSAFPPTLLIHGDSDAVVSFEQSQRFAQIIPYTKLLSLPHCGHAPHWHDTQAVIQAIAEHTNG